MQSEIFFINSIFFCSFPLHIFHDGSFEMENLIKAPPFIHAKLIEIFFISSFSICCEYFYVFLKSGLFATWMSENESIKLCGVVNWLKLKGTVKIIRDWFKHWIFHRGIDSNWSSIGHKKMQSVNHFYIIVVTVVGAHSECMSKLI